MVVGHEIDEECVDGDFRYFVAEQGDKSEEEGKSESLLCAIGVGAFLLENHFGEFYTREHQSHYNHKHGNGAVGHGNVDVAAEARTVAIEEVKTAKQCAEHTSEAVEGLRHVDAARRGAAVAEESDIGVGGSLEQTKSETQHKQRSQQGYQLR